MKILALEASATNASVAVTDGAKLLGEFYLHTGKTHSQTLMPMAENLLRSADLKINDIDLIAVSKGPGSFTGLRIAIAAAKGLALGADKKCYGASTLHALAQNLSGFEGYAAAAMDARCGQVYFALFELSNGKVTRLCEDCAISVEDAGKMLENKEKPVFLVGDGADLCYNKLLDKVPGLRLAPPHLRMHHASSVAALAYEAVTADEAAALSPDELLPAYLRLPQAERELLKKLK